MWGKKLLNATKAQEAERSWTEMRDNQSSRIQSSRQTIAFPCFSDIKEKGSDDGCTLSGQGDISFIYLPLPPKPVETP